MPDCVACTEAKQSVILFNKKGDHETLPGELTHVDVWGKYEVASINGHSYYLLLVDDASCYITVQFLKSKDQAVQKIMNYITHLNVQGKMPKAIRIVTAGPKPTLVAGLVQRVAGGTTPEKEGS